MRELKSLGMPRTGSSDMTTAMKGLTQQRDISSGLKGMTCGGGLWKNKNKILLRIQRQTLKGWGHVSIQGRGDGSCYRSHSKMLPVSCELFRSTVFFPLPYPSNSSLFPSPFQIPRREPSHSSSSVHRSLAESTLPDWSSSKETEQLKTLWSNARPPWSRRKTALIPLNAPLLVHSNIMCKNQHLFFFWQEADTTTWPFIQSPITCDPCLYT